MVSTMIAATGQRHNHRLKLPARSVTALALKLAGLGTDPGCARAAPGLAAAYPGRYTACG
jgi:hypothetical protein